MTTAEMFEAKAVKTAAAAKAAPKAGRLTLNHHVGAYRMSAVLAGMTPAEGLREIILAKAAQMDIAAGSDMCVPESKAHFLDKAEGFRRAAAML